MKKDKVAASVTVHQVADMTDKGRKAVCDWLRKLARDLQREPDAFSKTFRARYLYTDNTSVRGGGTPTYHERTCSLPNQGET